MRLRSTVRVLIFAAGLTALLLADEWVKEGYLFNLGDLGGLTHESLLVALWLAALGLILAARRLRP